MLKIIFTDLDDTLLKENKFEESLLFNFIQKLLRDNFIIIPVTSKTSSEVLKVFLKSKLNFSFSVENGAAHYKLTKNKRYTRKVNDNAVKSSKIKKILSKYIDKQYLRQIIIIENLNIKEQMRITRLQENQIFNFLKREFSVPILWNEGYMTFIDFKNELKRFNLKASYGGKMFNISGCHNKLDALKYFMEFYSNKILYERVVTISIGDSDNDIDMLNCAEYSGIVKNKSKLLKLEDKKNTFYSSDCAPIGWLEVVKKIKKQLEKDYI